MYDYHTHTAFSSDCDVPMDEMIQNAIDIGITHMAITDHHDPGYDDPEFPFQLDHDEYFKAISEAQLKYKEMIELAKGMEIGLMDIKFDECNDAVSRHPYDFIIGSFHCMGKDDFYRYDFSKVDKPSKLEEFYIYVNRCFKEYKNYDIAGHFTIIDRYIGGIFDYKPYMDIIEDTLKTIIYDGKGMEINTSSFKYGTGIWLPRQEVLELYHDLGGEILTFGSDSHDPGHFRDHFDEAHELARSIGFKYECTFKDRRPEFHKL